MGKTRKSKRKLTQFSRILVNILLDWSRLMTKQVFVENCVLDAATRAHIKIHPNGMLVVG